MQKANTAYEEKLGSGAQDKAMFSLSWDIEELKKLNTEGRELRIEISALCDVCTTDSYYECNVPRRLVLLRKRWLELTKRVTHFRRKPASHIFVMMVSTELRNKKPYAVPVQCVPYDGLKESDIRILISKLIKEMVKLQMNVAGIALNHCIFLTTN